MRLSTTLDWWKNSCHGATVVPARAMISRTELDESPPSTPGRSPRAPPPPGWLRIASGTTTKLSATSTYIARSQRRKLPVAVIAISSAAAIGTAT